MGAAIAQTTPGATAQPIHRGEGYEGERRLAADMGSGELAARQLYCQKDKTQAQAWVLGDVLVPLTGIELVTFALRMRCSTD